MNFLNPVINDLKTVKKYLVSKKSEPSANKNDDFAILRSQAKFIGMKALGIITFVGIAFLNYKKLTSVKFWVEAGVCVTAYNIIIVSSNAANLQKKVPSAIAQKPSIPSSDNQSVTTTRLSDFSSIPEEQPLDSVKQSEIHETKEGHIDQLVAGTVFTCITRLFVEKLYPSLEPIPPVSRNVTRVPN